VFQEELHYYRRAGEIARRTLEYATKIVKPGVKVLDVCERLEKKIIELGGKPAFPVNISINSIAAHYSPPINDSSIIPDNSLVKVDVGVHINGFIADTALTIALGRVDENLVIAAAEALRRAEEKLSPHVSTKDIGAVIEETIRRYGYRPISNLCGHQISKYDLHAGKVIPNIKVPIGSKLGKNTVYAIEPFSTNGAGYVVETREAHIFRLFRVKKIKKKTLYNKSIVQFILKEFNTLPFSLRWLQNIYDDINKLYFDIDRLIESKILYKYPVLVEARKGLVAQAEDTLVILEKDVVNLTNVLSLVI